VRDSENTSLTRSASGPSSSLGLGYSLPVTAPKALALDAGRWTLDASSPATDHTPPATPAPPDIVFLAFGQIRDGKNLDLFLRAMVHLPENVKLLVAGKGDSGSSRPPEFYQRLAGELGVASRCRWDTRKIPDGELGDIFAACDVVLATYGAKFRSASGVLNAAVSARKPVLASSGTAPLKKVVEEYKLGVFVEPDDVGAIVKGVYKILESVQRESDPRRAELFWLFAEWDRYEKENSWLENARKTKKHLTLK
jgi:glycosyltransferase involved in cell wall biosynthesis